MAGSIEKCEGKRGVYYRTRVELPLRPDGKRSQKTLRDRTYKGLERKQRDLLHSIDHGNTKKLKTPEKITLINFLNEYKENIKGINPGTYSHYLVSFNAFLRVLSPDLVLSKISTRMMQQAVNTLKETLKDSTVSGYLCKINKAFNYACRPGIHYMDENPVTDVIFPCSRENNEKIVWDDDTANRFIRSIKSSIWRYHVLFLLLLKTGLRVGEALALRWIDIDMNLGVVHVTRTIRKDYTYGPPKSKHSFRKVPFDKDTKKLLEIHRKKQAKEKLCLGKSHDPGELVFVTKNGKSPWPGPVNISFLRACKQFNVPYITVHGLRHTHATMLLHSGHSVNAVAERLGDRPLTIIKYYGHVTPGMQSEILRTIEQTYE